MDIDVLIPCYNAARYIGEAIESVLIQRAPVRSITVVDDGSDDDSGLVVAQFREHVAYHRQANSGISAARNACLALTAAPLVAFLDADDVWTDSSLEVRLETLLREHADGVAGAVEQFVSPELQGTRSDGNLPALTARAAGTMLLRRELFSVVGAFDTSLLLGDTLDWVSRADAAGIEMVLIDDIVLRRRLHDTNTGLRLMAHRKDYLRLLKSSIDRNRAVASAYPDEAKPSLKVV